MSIRSLALRAALALLLALSLTLSARAADDDVDTTFGDGGSFILDLGEDDEGIQDLLILSDGSIVGVGVTDGWVVLIKLDEDGNLDSSFGSGEGYIVQFFSGEGVEVHALAVDADGKLVVFGTEGGVQFFIARFNSDGSLDTDFNSPDGFVLLNFPGVQEGTAGAIQSDGKLIIGGHSVDDFFLARFNSDGTLDTANFGSPNGYVVQDLGGTDQAWGLALQDDGKIVLGGRSDNDFAVARFNTDGSLDTTTFGGGAGFTITDLGGTDRGLALGLQSDGKIVSAGIGNDQFAVARYTSAGVLDTSFASPDGYDLQDLGDSYQSHLAMAIDSTDEIVLVGVANTGAAGHVSIFRYLKDGDLDTSFSDDGWLKTNLLNTADYASAVGLGSILIGGSSSGAVDVGNFFFARFGVHDPAATASADRAETLPATGFAPGQVTDLPTQPLELAYSGDADLQLSIPSLNLDVPIVGVPLAQGSWDTRWLDQQVGYLQGTAFPTLPGNTALAGHVTDANGGPGPFLGLENLAYGDQMRIQAWGQTYTYEVRTTGLYFPDELGVLRHEDYDWLTLITCQDFDEASETYLLRRVVRAVLVSVD